MKNILSRAFLWASITLSQPVFWNVQEDTKTKVEDLIENKDIFNELNNLVLKLDIPWEDKKNLIILLKDQKIKEEFYNILKKEYEFSTLSIINAFILWFLYFLAYYSTIKRVRDNYMPIDPKSFLIFWSTSWGMAIINWYVPWSLLYIESFLLAFTAVFYFYKNKYENNVYNYNEKKQIELSILREISAIMPFPVVKYSDNWEPIIWNQEMEKETWYTFKEVHNYYVKKWNVMSLLYFWEEYNKVITYLYSLKNNLAWYQDVAFTLTTKFWKKKTFLWSTKILSSWWSFRVAKVLTDEYELKKELQKTNELLRVDSLTWLLNTRALKDDLHKLFSFKPKENEEKVFVIIDIDNFKTINDVYWHDFWDNILKSFSSFLKSKFRAEDKIYRYWWDEFIIVMDSFDFEALIEKFDSIRSSFYKKTFNYIKNWDWVKSINSKINISTSWWIKKIDLDKLYDQNETFWETEDKIKKIKEEADSHMYSVKYYHLIIDILRESWRISNTLDEWKNGIWIDLYNEKWEFIWVKVINNFWEFIITSEELEIIYKRKKELIKTKSWDLRN